MTNKTYSAAGVDIQAAARLKEKIGQFAEITFTKQVLSLEDDKGLFFDPSRFKRFKALFRLSAFDKPVLVSSVDGVGTKTKIATAMNDYRSLGADLVHHSVNDILIRGATALFFLDYLAMDKLLPETVEAVVASLSGACAELGCALLGGETAEMPGVYRPGEIDVVGFIVGAVEEEGVIDGSKIVPGDIVVALSSSGLHTNGYSLVRRIFGIDDDPKVLGRKVPELGHTLGEELLIVHRCYYPLLATVLEHIKSMAHITGGGLLENVPRILPGGLGALFHQSAWRVPPIFRLIQARGSVEPREMHRVFNMGIGLVVVVGQEQVASVQAGVPEAQPIGEVVKVEEGQERVVIEGA